MRKLVMMLGTALAAVVTLSLAAWGGVSSVQAQEVETATVERRTLGETVDTTGKIVAEETVYLSFGTSGIVREVAVEVGDAVTAGQELARLDIADLDYQVALKEQALIVQQTSYDELVAPPTDEEVAQAQASLASAQSQLESAQASLDTAPNQTTINCTDLSSQRTQLEDAQDEWDAYLKNGYQWDATFMPDPNSSAGTALRNAQNALDVGQAQCNNTSRPTEYEFQVTSAQASVNQAQAALDSLMSGATAEDIASAEAQLRQAQLELENARASLEDAVVTAPFDGVVAEINIVVGQLINNGTTAVTVVDISRLHVDVSVDELDIAQVAVGQQALVSPDAMNDQTIAGQVARIAPTGAETDGVVTYNVRVDLVDADGVPVRVGMTTDVEISLEAAGDSLVVPTEVIQRDGQTEYVEILENGTPTRVDITSGRTSDGYTEISGDLTEGVQVVIPAVTPTAGSGGFGGPFGGG